MFERINEGRWWNFGWQMIEGCTKVSPGCDNCWSLEKESRFKVPKEVRFIKERLRRPLERKKPTTYAIWNDLFHESISFEQIDEVFTVMAEASQHIFMILTKREERMLEYFKWLGRLVKETGFDSIPSSSSNMLDYVGIVDNIWLGVSCENQEQVHKRIPTLLKVPAAIRFVSVEPMLESLEFVYNNNDTYLNYLTGQVSCIGADTVISNKIDWIIAGPETGYKKRLALKEWFDHLYYQCKLCGVPFFDKKDVLGKGLRELPKH